ncbi:bacteriohemerythrin [Tepidimicrobium xylanilyticum]|uniref:Hemerythrin n=1 Tax=Tepidimicrobium xylanilyticum TaxID=1123352 RepID=A0A1H3BB78_9FIRM|nr:hemerythrin family protein [Tepidimicrobium xylanilyticum]GMG96969.1 hemerythrin [Tepidimicrobium xylanilyticum]SDX38279.1 hemerythrin [Tepidimicrobium xylanilyticum]
MMWKERYRIGVDVIDNQHKELFDRLSRFIQTVQKDTIWEDKMDDVKETLDFMKEYVIYHFNDEERYQEEINYPELEEHREAHDKFREGINEYVRIFEQGQFNEEKIKEFAAKLMTWLIMHVGKMDQRIGEYVRSKGGNA